MLTGTPLCDEAPGLRQFKEEGCWLMVPEGHSPPLQESAGVKTWLVTFHSHSESKEQTRNRVSLMSGPFLFRLQLLKAP